MTITLADLETWDRDDGLRTARDRFRIPEGLVYLDGNSLGALPAAAPGRVAEIVAQEWGQGLIGSWNDAGWIDLAARVADKIAAIIGAPPGTVSVADSTSVNLFKLLAAALALRPDRREILSEEGNFPTDLYVAGGLAATLASGHVVRTVPRGQIAAAIGADTAVVMVTHVNFRTGAMHDMVALTRAAHAAGAVMLWDLAHSAGAMPLDLAGSDAEFAVGCGYKFLNGGPGAPAFLYIRPDLIDQVRLPIRGWLGHESPFAFDAEYRPAPGIARATVGTAPIISLGALEAGVDTVLAADLHAVRAKSERMGSVFAELVEQACPGVFELASPADPAERGSQVCFRHPDAYAIMQALIARRVVGDFRAPDILRFGLTPLYVGYADLGRAAEILRDIMARQAWRAPAFAQRRAVT